MPQEKLIVEILEYSDDKKFTWDIKKKHIYNNAGVQVALDDFGAGLNDEAAIMDGAGYIKIFTTVILPLLKPAIVTVIILKGVGFYNEFYTPYLYMPKSELAVISTALFRFKGPYGTKWEVICAGVIITLLPALIMFLVMQKKIYSGLTSGAVKE